MSSEQAKKWGFATKAIHGGYSPNAAGALITPSIRPRPTASRRRNRGAGTALKRTGTSTPAQESQLHGTGTEAGPLGRGEAAVATASGMGAITSAYWSILKPGDHVVAGKALYGSVYVFLSQGVASFGVETTFVDTTDPEEVRRALRPNTKVVHLETPANPTLSWRTSGPSAKLPTGFLGVWCLWTTPTARRTCKGPWSWARMWCSIPPPNTSTGTEMCWRVSWWDPKRLWTGSGSSR